MNYFNKLLISILLVGLSFSMCSTAHAEYIYAFSDQYTDYYVDTDSVFDNQGGVFVELKRNFHNGSNAPYYITSYMFFNLTGEWEYSINGVFIDESILDALQGRVSENSNAATVFNIGYAALNQKNKASAERGRQQAEEAEGRQQTEAGKYFIDDDTWILTDSCQLTNDGFRVVVENTMDITTSYNFFQASNGNWYYNGYADYKAARTMLLDRPVEEREYTIINTVLNHKDEWLYERERRLEAQRKRQEEQQRRALERQQKIEAEKQKKKMLGEAKSYYDAGVALGKSGDYAESIRSYKAALKMNPEYQAAYFGLGYSYRELGDNSNAIEAYKNALALNPKDSAAYNNLGLIYAEAKDYQTAIDCYNKAITHDSQYAMAYDNLGDVYLAQNDYTKAIEVYTKAISLGRENFDIYFDLGGAYYNTDEYAKAIEAYQKAVKLNPKSFNVYYNLGLSYRNFNQPKEAIESFNKALKNKPDDARSYFQLGVTYDELKNTRKAIEMYEKALAIDPKYTLVYENLGSIYESQKEYGRALDIYQKAVSAGVHEYNIYNRIGRTYNKLNKHVEAIDFYQKALNIKPDEDDVYFWIGMSYRALGDVKETEKIFSKFGVSANANITVVDNNKTIIYESSVLTPDGKEKNFFNLVSKDTVTSVYDGGDNAYVFFY